MKKETLNQACGREFKGLKVEAKMTIKENIENVVCPFCGGKITKENSEALQIKNLLKRYEEIIKEYEKRRKRISGKV